MSTTEDDDAVAQELLEARERIKELENLVEARENKLKQMEEKSKEMEKKLSDVSAWHRADVYGALHHIQEVYTEVFSRGLLERVIGRDALPKKRQLAVTATMFFLLPLCMALTVFLTYIAVCGAPYIGYTASRTLACMLAAYYAYIYQDNSAARGSLPSKKFKSSWFFRQLREYFPVVLRKANEKTQFPADKKYMFGYHPHGIISVGCFVNFVADATETQRLFPGISFFGATLAANFKVPFFRELLLRLGCISVSASSIRYVLGMGPGNAVVIVPGGAAEALDARPGSNDLTLQRRSGFFRIALQQGVHLVPVYSFGENDLYPQALRNESGTLIRRVQEFWLKKIGYATPYFCGSGALCMPAIPGNPIPRRHPIITVIGDPIECPKIEHPTEADIEKLKVQYIDRLNNIFTQFADEYAPDRKSPLRIIK